MKLRDLPRLARTLRPLRASQLVWRGRYALERRLPPPHIRLPAADDVNGLRARVASAMPRVSALRQPGAAGGALVEPLSRGEFAHLNRTERLGRPGEIDWRLGPRSRHRLWTITLHYHAWAYELARQVADADGPFCDASRSASELLVRLLEDWIARCDVAQPGARDLAWNSFAIATRLGWWARLSGALGCAWWEARPEFHGRFLESFWRQAAWLHAHPEWDLRGNHVLRNAVGLAWAGRFFTGESPRKWLAASTTIAFDQAAEQVLPDGGHFERSPMYHVHAMEDVLYLSLLLDDPAARSQLRQTWEAMAEWLAWMRHPDGDIPLFNDAALGAVATPTAMFAAGEGAGYAASREPRRGGRFLTETGMCVWHGDPWSVFFDVGDVGPDCQPGHAHADTLSIECSYRGRRLFVDAGTHSYDHDDVRRYDRGTASHNTVCVDGRDSSEVWHVFRVGARARPRDVRVEIAADGMVASASHDGYDGLPGRPRPARTVHVDDGGPLRVVDRITGSGTHTVTGGWLLAPEWKAVAATGGWELEAGGERLRLRIDVPEGAGRFVEPAVHHPQYGVEIATQRLAWRFVGSLPVEIRTVVERA